jgi:hypothetical protein
MPIYEYYCPDNNRIYQFYAKTVAQGQLIPKCPDNPEFKLVRIPSTFAISSRSRRGEAEAAGEADREGAEGPSGATSPNEGGGGRDEMDDPRMEAAFSELERDMESVDENDPRAMGRMMRKMAEITGEPLDEGMEEVVRKLEEGQDPDKLEEQMGEAFPESDEGGMGGGGFGGFGGRRPSRDPNLYDYD